MSGAGRRVVIVGASVAGLTVAETLREGGFDGRLTLVGDEAHPPYDRPPLSKQVLSGAWEPDRVLLRPSAGELGAELLTGRAATSLDLERRVVGIGDGEQVPYDTVVIATGVRARRPRYMEGVAGVQVLRTLGDAVRLRAALLGRPRLVVIGGGFLGTEVAGVARGMGAEVTVVEPGPVPLAGPLGMAVGARVAALHREHGVRLRTGVTAGGLTSSGGRVTGVELDDGSVAGAEVVLVAIGSVPATGWLAGSGVPVGDGVLCDGFGRAAPGVYAAGDVARWDSDRWDGDRWDGARFEHRTNATDQGRAVARTILGDPRPLSVTPYFWSDQYDVKLQVYGTPDGADAELTEGGNGGRFTARYLRGGRVTAVLGWNSPREVLRRRELLLTG
ncbi:NAD(P)/FAD-dependent oxidoreductase [Nonomuraea insulae]|uniref:NAD(P)/FAD-dependent oxidoreductase n=1 Tax=Nonomuraea insulae TaxID=1616787 RepID=A0ABW1D677_9ACTN